MLTIVGFPSHVRSYIELKIPSIKSPISLNVKYKHIDESIARKSRIGWPVERGYFVWLLECKHFP